MNIASCTDKKPESSPMEPNHDKDPYCLYKTSSKKSKSTTFEGIQFQINKTQTIKSLLYQDPFQIRAVIEDQNSEDEPQELMVTKIIDPYRRKVTIQETLRNLKIMRLLEHDNILKLHDIQLPENRSKLAELYLTTDKAHIPLSQFIQEQEEIDEDYIKFIIYQILCGLKYLHSAGIAHRDLKPENIFLDENFCVKITGFDHARLLSLEELAQQVPNYNSSFWYGAPEKNLSTSHNDKIKDIGFTSDIWSVGCIMAQMLTGVVLFEVSNTDHLIEKYVQIFGELGKDDVSFHPEESVRKYMMEIKQKDEFSRLENLFSGVNSDALELVLEMLKFNPEKRCDAEKALQFEYLAEFHDPDEEATCEKISEMEFEFEKYILGAEQLKDLLYEEILMYHSEEFAEKYRKRIEKNQSVISHIVNGNGVNGKIDKK